MGAEAPWLDKMISMIGEKEIVGKKHNPLIVSFAAECGHPEVKNDETAYCAFGMGFCLKKTGYPIPPVEVNPMARSYLRYGTPLSAPVRGAIAIWPRGNSKTQGHVNIVDEVDGDKLICVGANQDNSINRTKYNAKNALGFRWPPEKAATITVVKTAVKSRRFMGALTSFIALVFGAILDGMKSLVDSIGWLIDGIPGMDHCYDCAMFVYIARECLQTLGRNTETASVKSFIHEIMAAIGLRRSLEMI